VSVHISFHLSAKRPATFSSLPVQKSHELTLSASFPQSPTTEAGFASILNNPLELDSLSLSFFHSI
jgi:hypothetical protein